MGLMAIDNYWISEMQFSPFRYGYTLVLFCVTAGISPPFTSSTRLGAGAAYLERPTSFTAGEKVSIKNKILIEVDEKADKFNYNISYSTSLSVTSIQSYTYALVTLSLTFCLSFLAGDMVPLCVCVCTHAS